MYRLLFCTSMIEFKQTKPKILITKNVGMAAHSDKPFFQYYSHSYVSERSVQILPSILLM